LLAENGGSVEKIKDCCNSEEACDGVTSDAELFVEDPTCI